MTPCNMTPIFAISVTVSVSATFSHRNWVQLLVDRTIVLLPWITSCELSVSLLIFSQNKRKHLLEKDTLGRMRIAWPTTQLAVEWRTTKKEEVPSDWPQIMGLLCSLRRFSRVWSLYVSIADQCLYSHQSAPTILCCSVSDGRHAFWKG